MKRLNSIGATHIAFAALILVIVGVGFAAYRVVGVKHSAKPSTSQVAKQSDKLKTSADIKQASSQLDSADVDKSLDSSQLDSDLNDLL